MDKKIYSILNGKLVLAERAAIPVADRGFRFGDGVFETIYVQQGVPYQWDLHIARLEGGLVALHITEPTNDWAGHAKKLLKKNGVSRGFLRIAVSRGVGSRGYAPHPHGMPCTWVMETLPALPAPENPYTLWLSQIPRIPRQCLPVNFKLAQGINNTLAYLEAEAHQCSDALQLTTEGFIAETSSANIFWVKDGALYTSPLDTGCLNGTTRDAVIRLSPTPVRMQKVGISAITNADAAFLTNCRLGVWPIAELKPMGKTFTTRNRLVQQLAGLLRADIAQYAAKHKKHWGGKR